MNGNLFLLRIGLLLGAVGYTQTVIAQNDSLSTIALEQVDIESAGGGLITGRLSGRMDIALTEVERAPKVLAFADPLRFLQSLPGVQTTSELQGGLFVDGTGNSHTLVTIGGAPVYNPSHLLGIFSMFNPLHFREMSFSKRDNGTGGRLGGLVEMRSNTSYSDRIHFKADAGVLGSMANLKIPMPGRSVLSVSGRAIYFNFMSDHYLKHFWNDNTLHYHFNDMNVTWHTGFESGDELQIDCFSGSDKSTFDVIGKNLLLKVKWRNTLYSATWKHKTANGHLDQTFYRSAYFCRFNANLEGSNLFLPGGLSDCSYKLDGYKVLENGMLQYGARLSHYRFEEQTPMLTAGAVQAYGFTSGTESNNACANVRISRLISGDNLLELSLTGNLFYSDNDTRLYAHADPSVSVSHTFPGSGGILGLKVGTLHQYLHLCGFTTNGLPTEFWMPSDGSFRPESSASITASYERDMFDGKINFQAEVYCKSLNGTVELDNSVIEAVNEGYSMWENIRQGNGYAYGLNVMMGNRQGALDWLVSYSFGHSLTRLEGSETYSPCFYDRPHDLKIKLGWNMNSRWNFSANGLVCSGTPFTMPKYAYVMNETVVVEYGEHNNARLPANWRVDLSAGWTLKQTDSMNCGLDFSLYNAFFAHNVLYYFYNKRADSDTYLMKRFMPMPVCLPSVTFHIEF